MNKSPSVRRFTTYEGLSLRTSRVPVGLKDAGFQLPEYQRRYRWRGTPIDELERHYPPKHPLLPLLDSLDNKLPKKWDNKLNKYIRNDDWLLWNVERRKIEEPYG